MSTTGKMKPVASVRTTSLKNQTASQGAHSRRPRRAAVALLLGLAYCCWVMPQGVSCEQGPLMSLTDQLLMQLVDTQHSLVDATNAAAACTTYRQSEEEREEDRSRLNSLELSLVMLREDFQALSAQVHELSSAKEKASPKSSISCEKPFEWVGDDCINIVTSDYGKWFVGESKCKKMGAGLVVPSNFTLLQQRLKAERVSRFWVGAMHEEGGRGWFWTGSGAPVNESLFTGSDWASRGSYCASVSGKHDYGLVKSDCYELLVSYICQIYPDNFWKSG